MEYWEPRRWFSFREVLKRLYGRGYGGLYWIRLPNYMKSINYPLGESSIVYIGQSTNLYRRLNEHRQKRTRLGEEIHRWAKETGLGDPWRILEVGVEILLVSSEELKEEEERLLKAFVARFGAAPQFNGVVAFT